MYIIVAGGGLVGGEMARALVNLKHDVVVIDPNRETCDRIFAEAGIVAVHGSAARIDVLKEAGIERAKVVVAATPYDAENLACALLAKSFEVPKVMVRMRDPNYENAYRVAGVDSIVHVIDLMVNRITTEIENPEVRRVAAIGSGQAYIFSIVIPEGGRMVGQTIGQITQGRRFPQQCVFSAVCNQKTQDFAIPRGNYVLQPLDEIFLVAPAAQMKAVVKLLTSH